MLHVSTGVLRYGFDERAKDLKLVVEIDHGIAETYRAIVPKHYRVSRPRFAPHISVVRHEAIPADKMHLWSVHEGAACTFSYDPTICYDETYFWLRVYSDGLVAVREELGLHALSELARPPDRAECFHTTIANRKTTTT